MLFDISLQYALVVMVVFALSIAVHEAAHALVLYLFGDRRAHLRARISLDMQKHWSLFGVVTMCIFGVSLGKPIIMNEKRFKSVNKAIGVMILTKLAGPLANILTALLGTVMIIFMYRLEPNMSSQTLDGYLDFYGILCYINVLLFVINMLPLPGLDGGFLWTAIAMKFKKAEMAFTYSAFVSIIGLLIVSYTKIPAFTSLRTDAIELVSGFLNTILFTFIP